MPRINAAASTCRRHGGRRRHALLAHEKAAVAARLDQAQRQQPVVGRHHRGRADLVLFGTLAHRRQPRAGGQQTVADALGKMGGQLFRERLRGGAHQHGAPFQMRQMYRLDGQYSCVTALVNCIGTVLVRTIESVSP
jgi:hypothetical protein